MGAEHTEGILEKAVAFMRDMFGGAGNSAGRATVPSAAPEAGFTSEDAMRRDPDAYTFQSVGELHLESRRRTDREY
jgi:hypothetical protein